MTEMRWNCDECKQPVVPEQRGMLFVETKHLGVDDETKFSLTMSGIRAKCLVLHAECIEARAPALQGLRYITGVASMRTEREALLHVLTLIGGRPWLGDSDFEDVIARACFRDDESYEDYHHELLYYSMPDD